MKTEPWLTDTHCKLSKDISQKNIRKRVEVHTHVIEPKKKLDKEKHHV